MPNPLPRAVPDAGRYRAIARELPHGAVFVVDRALRYVLADGAELKQAGFVPQDFEGKTIREVVPPELADQYEHDYRTVLDGGTFAREHEVNARRYRSYGVPLTNGRGEAALALVVSYGVSEHADPHMHRIIALLAHELRNPLSTLSTGFGLLDKTVSDPRVPSTAETLARSCASRTTATACPRPCRRACSNSSSRAPTTRLRRGIRTAGWVSACGS